ncbi:MAG: trigger factor [Peptococcaceae bacterium]|nr:trigger factor [Peptococcaceae bacterium]
MAVKVEKLDKVKVELTVEVAKEVFEDALQQAYKSMAPRLKADGFRNGKVPRSVAEKLYGPEIFYEEAANRLVMTEYIKAVKELKEQDETFQPIAQPDFDLVQIEKGKEFIFKAIVDTKQEIALGDYKGLDIEEIMGEVSDKEVEQYLDQMRGRQAEVKTITDRRSTLKVGDTANIDFVGKKDGVAFPGGAGEGFDLVIGSGQFIPGFEDQMVGMKTGDEKALDITFPENYPAADLAGQPVVFEVKLNAIKRKVLPELNDEFAKDVSNFETLAEYKEDIRVMLAEEKGKEIQTRYKAAVSAKVVEGSDVVAPESMVKDEAENYMNDIRYQLAQQGFSLEQYVQLTGATMEKLEEDCRLQAEAFVKQRLVLEAIAEKEGIDVTDEEMEKEFGVLAEMYQQPVDQVKQMFTARGQLGLIKRNILLEKVTDFLLENAKIG